MKLKIGQKVWLKEFDNGEEVFPREECTVAGPSRLGHPEDALLGEGDEFPVAKGDCVCVWVEDDDASDDGLREVPWNGFELWEE